ncbi:MAG: hypothetical protein MJ016_02360 [Victivallaceae bacterium]|nr:hypothetical protein [Victivallaceae bacterium]
MKKTFLPIAFVCLAVSLFADDVYVVEQKPNVVGAAFDTVGAACTVVLKGTCDIIDGVVNFGDRTVMVRQSDGAIRHYYPAETSCSASTPVNRTTITATQYATVVQMENAQPCSQTYIFRNQRCGYYNGWVFYDGSWIPAPNRVQVSPAPTWVPLLEMPRRNCGPVIWYR